MRERLLREYLSLVMEKIRSQKGVKGKFGSKFDLKRFKSLGDPAIMVVYANHFLEVLGEGSSRRAWVLGSKYALKIAINKKGIAQNEAEMDIFTNPKTQAIVAKVYASDPSFHWLISDLVKPLSDPAEFKQLTGVDWDNFVGLLDGGIIRSGEKLDRQPRFVQTIVGTARQNNLLKGDIKELGHWGKTHDGRCVLLDYGFTGNVYASHYSTSKDAPKSAAPDAKTRAPGNTDNKGTPVDVNAATAPAKKPAVAPDRDEEKTGR